MRTFSAFVALMIAMPVLAGEPWDTTDKALGVAALAFIVRDYGQTRTIAKNPHLYREVNPLLGEHPSLGRVNTHFAIGLIGGYLIADWLPSRDRKWFLGAVTVIEIGVTEHNRSIGIKIDF